MANDEQLLLTTREVAALLGSHASYVLKLGAAGRLERVGHTGRPARWTRRSVDRFIDEEVEASLSGNAVGDGA